MHHKNHFGGDGRRLTSGLRWLLCSELVQTLGHYLPMSLPVSIFRFTSVWFNRLYGSVYVRYLSDFFRNFLTKILF